MPSTPRTLYVYRWRNNCKRLAMRGRLCTIVARAGYSGQQGRRFNTRLARFVDNGQTEVVSGNALRKAEAPNA